MSGGVSYRGYKIYFIPTPIPDRSFDYQWVHDDYDGPEDHRIGAAASYDAARKEIDEQIEDMAE